LAKDTTKQQEQTLASYDKNLEAKTLQLEMTLTKWKEAEASMETFNKLLNEAFNVSGCSNAGIVSLLGKRRVSYNNFFKVSNVTYN